MLRLYRGPLIGGGFQNYYEFVSSNLATGRQIVVILQLSVKRPLPSSASHVPPTRRGNFRRCCFPSVFTRATSVRARHRSLQLPSAATDRSSPLRVSARPVLPWESTPRQMPTLLRPHSSLIPHMYRRNLTALHLLRVHRLNWRARRQPIGDRRSGPAASHFTSYEGPHIPRLQQRVDLG